MNEPIIQLSHIQVEYNGKQVLRDINLTVYSRDFLGIIGPNGGGKTTLIKTILGLKKSMSGTISFYHNGMSVPSIRMGYLPQYSHIDKDFPISVYEVILSGLKKSFWKRYSKAQHHAVQEMLERMGLTSLSHRPIGTLSGGQLQRVLLGRAVISEPDVVILDEPNTYIDKQFEAQLYQQLEEFNRKSAIILVSHDLESVLQNVRSIACVNGTLDYHPDTELPEGWIEDNFKCPIELIGHGDFPHRVLQSHKHS
ncbi:MAG: metal ABC transporter ATP-binding protein [Paraprevotella sp.]|nr:metal ABC transporter ATP-binding protein [Paraprevotella sp.]